MHILFKTTPKKRGYVKWNIIYVLSKKYIKYRGYLKNIYIFGLKIFKNMAELRFSALKKYSTGSLLKQ